MGKWLVAVSVLSLTIFPGLSQGCPTIAVFVPETVVIERVPRRVPDPAAETELIRLFLRYGFKVVDLVHIALLRKTPEDLEKTHELAKRALAGDQTAIREIALDKVDILVVGEGLSTVTVFEALIIPGQPNLQDARARLEIRAIEVSTGRILAAEAIHTGGLDFSPELAGKKSLQRAAEKIACTLATSIAENHPFPPGCFKGCPEPVLTLGALSFQGVSPDVGQIFATAVETALSKAGCRTARAMAADYLIQGQVTDWKELKTPPFDIPFLGVFFRFVAVWLTVDIRVLNVATAEFEAFEVAVELSGIEILFFRFGVSTRDIARAVAEQIASRICSKIR
ncbi:MAG: hypothetical protein QW734_11450 [Candidatus Bathyarchaeia archaeon]